VVVVADDADDISPNDNNAVAVPRTPMADHLLVEVVRRPTCDPVMI
jgi:hypothetical protein